MEISIRFVPENSNHKTIFMKKLTLVLIALLVGTVAALASRAIHPPIGICCNESQTICKVVGTNVAYGPFGLDTCP